MDSKLFCHEGVKSQKEEIEANFSGSVRLTEEELAGYCVFEPASGDVAQIAVKPQYRRKGIAGLLLREMLRLNRNDSIKIINTDVSCGSITGFLQAKNIVPQGKQFEMIRKI